jgi:hypothetical protein
MDENATQSDAEVMTGLINQKHTGADKRHKVMALSRVRDFKPYTLTPKEMDFLGLRNLPTKKVTTVTGVPEFLLGNHNTGDYASGKFLVREFHETIVTPVQEIFAEGFSENLVHTVNDELKLYFNKPDASDPDDRRKDQMQAKSTGILTANEVRQDAFGKEPVAGQDDLSTSVQIAPGEKPSAEGGKDEDAATEPNEKLKKSIAKALSSDERDQIAAERETELDALTQDAIPGINSFFDEQSARYQNRLGEFVRAEGGLDAFLAAATPAEEAFVGALFTTLLYPSLFAGAQAEQLQINMTLRFGQINPFIQDYLKTQGLQHAKVITTTTTDELRATLQQGIQAGKGIPQLADRISTTFEEAKGRRSYVIARSEASQAFQHANHSAAEATELDLNRRWICSLDEKLCKICAPHHEELVGLYEPYAEGEEPSEAHIQCRCTEIYKVVE